MHDLKKMISRYMQVITAFMVIIILVVATIVNILNAQLSAQERAESMFIQIEQLLEENQQDLEVVKENYSQTCLNNAMAIAYILEHNPTMLESAEEFKKIAEFMEVDEIHIFDETGRIFAGTHPEYYNLTLDSGEQIGFFKPMLEDKSLKLVQDITPNTAEEKLMQYSALWSESGEIIVQVGMEPVNVMQATEKNELSYIFSQLRVNVGVDFYAIDATSWKIVGATSVNVVGKNLAEIGFNMEQIKRYKTGFQTKVNGVDSYCVFKKIGSTWIGRVVSNDVLYENIPASVLGLALCCVLMGVILVWAVTRYMNRYVVDGIHSVNDKLRSIAAGNLDENVDVENSTEFKELSTHINEMVRNLLKNNKKMSYVLSKTDMYIGVYEYNSQMNKVRVTEYVPRILGLNDAEAEVLASNYVLFQEFIGRIRENPLPNEESIFRIAGEKERYVRIEESNENREIFGVVIDVTEDIIKRKQIEAERDIDVLTGLYNRRGLENRLAALFSGTKGLDYGALIMIDADGLKVINDKYGHEDGDVYLQKIANIIKGFGIKESVAARLGGDEFVLFLYGYNSNAELLRSIESLHYIQDNSTVNLAEGISVPLRFSFGYTVIDKRVDYSEMLKEADEKMYESKRVRKAQEIKV